MKKGWRVILEVVAVAVVLGALCFGVGLLTGADMPRIIQNLDTHFQLSAYVDAYTGYFTELFQYIVNLF